MGASTTRYLTRATWTRNRLPAERLSVLDADTVRGVALHWPGSKTVIGKRSAYEIGVRLESYREDHVTSNGWADIAYQVAVDQVGRVWDLRTFRYMSAANGSRSLNAHYGAILVLVGQAEELSAECKEALRDVYQDRWLKLFPKARNIVGHGDIRPQPTLCPGRYVDNFIDSGYMKVPSIQKPSDPHPTVNNGGNNVVLYYVDQSGDGEKCYQIIGSGRRYVTSTEVKTMRRQGIVVAMVPVSASDPIMQLPELKGA